MAYLYRISSLLIAPLLLLLGGCHVPSRVAIEGNGGRNAYNDVLQQSNNEQMLLNLVRLRYDDFPFFLEINNVTTTFTYGAKASGLVPIPGFTKQNPFELGGEVSWQNQPTIQYTPLDGHTFSNQLMTPVDLLTVQLLYNAGWDIERLVRLTIQSIDELTNAGGGTILLANTWDRFEKFVNMTRLMRYFQEMGELSIGIKMPKNCPDAKDCEANALQISFPANNQYSKDLAELLDAHIIHHDHYVVDLPMDYNKEVRVGIKPRSLLAIIGYLSLAVEVPKEHVRSGRVNESSDLEGELIDCKDVVGDLMVIKSSKCKPRDAYVWVKYGNYWYYIDNDDTRSKRTFVLLLQLYNLQSGDVPKNGPILTLPIGVG
ncbi:MAG: hypothetical protein S4CHLAM102_16420 [Chlamydiia bacterium]|nr:hypothetical protein [Chlamydiia bacterium]